MLCSHCGAHLMDDETVCSRCGARREVEVPVGKDGKPKPTREEIERKKDRRADIFARITLPIIGTVCSIAAFCIIVWLAFNFLKDYSNNLDGAENSHSASEQGLCLATDIETNLKAAYIRAKEGTADDYAGVSRFEIEDVEEETHDQTFNCVVASSYEMAIAANGLLKEGQVVQLQTVLTTDGERYDGMNANAQSSLLAFAVFSASIFKEDVAVPADFTDFISSMDVVSDPTHRTSRKRIVEGDIEYTYMCGRENGKVVATFTVRYRPAFTRGFFEEHTAQPTVTAALPQKATYLPVKV